MIATLAVSNVVASFTLTTSIMKKKTSTLRQDATRITNFQALGIDLNVHHHCIHPLSQVMPLASTTAAGTSIQVSGSPGDVPSERLGTDRS